MLREKRATRTGARLPSLLVAPVTVVTLSACSGEESVETRAHNACIADAILQLPDGVERMDTSDISTFSFSEAVRVLADNPLGASETEAWTTSGSLWYRYDGRDHSEFVMCITEFTNGQPDEPVKSITTIGEH